MNEFLEASFAMFEGVKQRSDSLLNTLERIVAALEKKRSKQHSETEPVVIYLQTDDKPEFQPPSNAWQDEANVDDPEKHNDAWKDCGSLKLPTGLTTVEEVAGLIRLFLKMNRDTWLSLFFCGPSPDGGPAPITLLRGERAGEGNVQATLEYLSKPNAAHRIFVKNQRKRPTKLVRQSLAFMDEREALLAKRTGQCWGVDWETQLVGDGEKLPNMPVTINIGDALVIEVPTADDSGEYRYVSSVFMDRVDVVSKPVDENIEKAGKKKKKKAAAPKEDPLVQFSFVAMKEGKSIIFVDVSWEDQEEKLCKKYKLVAPVAENTIARIGPLEIEVVKPTGKQEKGFVWWNGEKWSAKKGPAKKKKGKKK